MRSLVLGMVLLLIASSAWAQPRVSSKLDADEVEAGDAFTLTLEASVEGNEEAHSPRLIVPRGIIKTLPTLTTKRRMQVGGGTSSFEQTLTATWQLIASEPGAYTIRAPTVMVGSREVSSGSSLRVTVHPSGSGLAPRRSQSTRPFPIGIDDFMIDPTDSRVMTSEGRTLRMSEAPHPWVFLRAVADKQTAVVGEQVTISYYQYTRYPQVLRGSDRSEPTFGDFLRVPIDTPPSATQPLMTRVGGKRFQARLIDRVALFPLRTGELPVGQITGRFSGPKVGTRVPRESTKLTITVRAPPAKDRPLGYRVGTVGDFNISATVEPRSAKLGGAVTVAVKVTGTGSVPSALRLPERTGVSWLKPAMKHEVQVRNGVVGGWRTFSYVVRLNEIGEVKLGEIQLPHYDPDSKAYRVARVELGNVLVQQGDKSLAQKDDDDPFNALAKPRKTLGEYAGDDDGALSPKALWPLVTAPPLGIVLLGGLHRLLTGFRRRRQLKKDAPGTKALGALSDMKRAKGGKAAAAAAERAIHLAIESATGIRSRGVLLAALPDELAAKGLDDDAVSEVVALLEECSTIRFDPDPVLTQAKKLRNRTRPLVKRLIKIDSGGT